MTKKNVPTPEIQENTEEVVNYNMNDDVNYQGNSFSGEETLPPTDTVPTEVIVNHINVLIDAVNFAQTKGIYNLEEAARIWNTIEELQVIFSRF